MPTYDVKSRKTMPIEVQSVQAESPEDAIQKTLETEGEGESIEVMNVTETAPDTVNPSKAKEVHPAPHPAPAPAKK